MPNPNPKRSKATEFKPGHQAAFKHGGEAAVKAIQKGEPLRGAAREVELAVYAELETQGRYSLVKRNAARLQAAADLYWGAICKLMDMISERPGYHGSDRALASLDKYIARFGWLSGAALRAWGQVKEEEGDRPHVVDYEELLSEAD